MSRLIGGKLHGREVDAPVDLLAETMRNYPIRLKINGRWVTVSQWYELDLDKNYRFVAIQIDADELIEKFGDDWHESFSDPTPPHPKYCCPDG